MENEIETRISEALADGKPIRVRLYALLQKTEEELNTIVTSVLDKYNKPDLLGAVYTSVKELALNGAKANIKRILFHEMDIDPENEESYKEGMAAFKTKLTEEFISDYANKARNANLFVDVKFDYNPDRLIVEVINNSAMSEKEDYRVREKFKKGSQYDNIAEFYMDMQDNAEGAGMGITLILMLLKAEGIDPHLFTIKSDYKTKTYAKVEFPLSDSYVPERKSFS